MATNVQPVTQVFMGALLLALVTVEIGGYFLTRVARGHVPANALQVSFFRAGHAHAGVLLVLSLVILSVIDGTDASGALGFLARTGVPLAAILMPAGFFLSVVGRDPTQPNRLLVLLWLGAASLAVGLISSGFALIVAGSSAPHRVSVPCVEPASSERLVEQRWPWSHCRSPSTARPS